MIVEDEVIVAMDMREHLQKLGYSVPVMATSGEEALLNLEETTPDVILMDIKLEGEIDGIETAALIKKRFSIPVIFLTSYGDDKTIERASRTEPFGYLSKPLKDMSELRAAIEIALYKHGREEELLRISKLESLGILAGGIAHDFNNLLYVILGNIELIKEKAPGAEEVREFISEAQNACLSARELTRQLITFSSGGRPLRKQGEINRLIYETAAAFESGSNIKVEFDPANDLRLVEFDRDQMAHVIRNILINAAEAAVGPGRVVIRTRNIDGDPDKKANPYGAGLENRIEITVTDSGKGISEKDLPRIFDPYFSTKQRRGGRGMGLGLATAYSIIKKHGGEIKVKSEKGAGASVRIYLPAYDPGPSAAVSGKAEGVFGEPQAGTGSNAGTKKILVMDDEPDVRKLLARMLKRLGYDAALSENGEEAIRMFQAERSSGEPFDAVILDLTVKNGMGGRDAIKILKEIDPHVKGIVTSGYSSDPVMSDYGRYGFCSSISKPCSLKDFELTLAEVVG